MTFSEKSWGKLDSCDPRLRDILVEVIKEIDCTVICGHRSRVDQTLAFQQGNTKAQWPNSKHNKLPSMAVDVAPYPIDWNHRESFYHLAGYIKAVAKDLNIEVRWGGDWDRDNDFKDNDFDDLVHYELV